MRWMKVDAACEHLGGVSAKTLYQAVRNNKCQAARIGAGRNLLFSDVWLDEYAQRCATKAPGAVDATRFQMKRSA
jgi:hypothetical protein